MRKSEVRCELTATVRCWVSGPCELGGGDPELELRPPKRLALLALLLQAPGLLPLHEAIDILWDTEPPASAVNMVHRHIRALRRTREPELRTRSAAEQLVHAADGYLLAADATALDFLRLPRPAHPGTAVGPVGRPGPGRPAVRRALRLGRGPIASAGSYLARHPLFISVGHDHTAAVRDAADAVPTEAPTLTEEVLAMLRPDRRPRPVSPR